MAEAIDGLNEGLTDLEVTFDEGQAKLEAAYDELIEEIEAISDDDDVEAATERVAEIARKLKEANTAFSARIRDAVAGDPVAPTDPLPAPTGATEAPVTTTEGGTTGTTTDETEG